MLNSNATRAPHFVAAHGCGRDAPLDITIAGVVDQTAWEGAPHGREGWHASIIRTAS
jgi:hypothetical protein